MDKFQFDDCLAKWKRQNSSFEKEVEKMMKEKKYFYNLGWLQDYLARHPELGIRLILKLDEWHLESCSVGGNMFLRPVRLSCDCLKAIDDPENFIKTVKSYRGFAEMMSTPRVKKEAGSQ